MTHEPTRVLDPQLNGDVSKLPALSDIGPLSGELRLVVDLLGSAAMIAGRWVGVNAPIAISQLDKLHPLSPFVHPMAWMVVFGENSMTAIVFRAAERQGLVHISNTEKGCYYEPTQALVDMMMESAKA